MLLLAVLLAAATLLGVVFLVTRPDRRRGVATVVALAVVLAGGSPAAPELLRTAVPYVAGGVLLLGAITGERRRSSRDRESVVVLTVLAITMSVVTLIVFPVALPLVARQIVVGTGVVLSIRGFSAEDRRVLVGGVIALAFAESMLAVTEAFVTHQPVPWGYNVGEDGRAPTARNALLPGLLRVQGTLGHPIPFAVVVAAALLLVLARWRSAGPVLRWLVAPLFVVVLVLSGSRSVVIGVVAGGLVMLWSSSTAGNRVHRVLSVLGATVVAWICFAGDLLVLVAALVQTGSWTNRAGAFEAVPALLGRSPLEMLFGSGFGSDFELYDRGFFPQDGFRVVDNQLVTTLGTGGVVGALLVFVLFVLSWRTGDFVRRGLLTLFAGLLFSFDYFGWPSMLLLLCAVVVLPGPEQTVEQVAPAPMEED